ncbi:MAG: HAMP domain-containing protein [Clostridia bacterium]|nr:HAMP domain-containing protein [Clostridia bacterium]
MFRNTILKRTLAIILSTVLLSALITGIVFNYSGRHVFSEIKAGELLPRAKYLADVTGEYMQGLMGRNGYERAIGGGFRVWDAAMYAYNSQGRLFAYPGREDDEKNIAAVSEYLDTVLGGEGVYSPNTRNRVGVIIGEPVIGSHGAVIGAVFLVKPLNELNAALHSLLIALIISMVVASAIMIIPAYMGSRRIVEPVRQMNVTANAMAGGDFSVKASEEGTEEIAQLGRSLNHLSAALYSTIRDLTIEKNRLHSVINGLGEGIIATDDRGEIIKINSAALKLLGGNEEDDITHLAAYDELKRDMDAAHGGSEVSREMKIRERILRIYTTPLEYEGKNRGAVTMLRDITEAARLEQTRIDYVANVSHELRTPLASIRALADALNDGMVKSEGDRARYYGYILHESMRLSRLIDDLLELSRLQSGSVALTRQFISIEELIFDVADRFSEAAAEKGLKVEAACDYSGRAYTNPDRAEQVLVALIDNAIKHCEGPGTVEIKAFRQEEKLRISVSNPGSVADEDIEHLFERFYKADRAHSGEGTGLGLSIVWEVLSLLGERIWVKSRDGKVTFTFTLPLQKE